MLIQEQGLTASLPTPFDNSVISNNSELQRFFALLQQAMAENCLQRLLLSKYQGSQRDLQRLEIRPVEIKSELLWRFVWQYQTNHQTRNYPFTEALSLLTELLPGQFKAAQLSTTTSDAQLTISKKGKALINIKKNTVKQQADTSHNRQKQRFVEQSRPFLSALGVTDQQGQVIPAMSNKWKQINKFIEVLQGAVKESGLLQAQQLHVADFGSGKAYLTFAMHDYFCHSLGLDAQITGVELRQNLVDLCNKAAAGLNLAGLHFEQGDVKHFKARGINVMVALHACDVATDYAINMGIRTGAEIIMCSPCCHKEIRPQIRLPEVMAPMLIHGIHLGQEAEMVTDSLRALLLEAHGYQTKVFEFISLEHTSKNKMILATKRKKKTDNSAVLRQIAAIKDFYGIKQQCLEQLLLA
ncbi:Methyltransferase domain-containing protein [Arsukibacterium tuosuense]|uniref:Methyltransferase domain-containing protein n=1 Tax=Arsukibacterium tuosuense TaxID=1323745 RepID=A0A285I239_9GAMM|nr:Methyltransferase domain-containing protein [Arsukibacterium tuosuense]